MQRAHCLPEAAGLCFVDSTASCDAQNHSITFMLMPCAAGAVPVAVIITDGQAKKDYTAGFRQLRECGLRLFGGNGYPEVFMTDDSDAEQQALHAVWPESRQTLCLFHVPQANWRWLWDTKNMISKDDRPKLMTEFKSIMLATNPDEAEMNFETVVSSSLSGKYPNWRCRVQSYWERRERWCVAWRSAVHRGHHTNNFSEITVRLFKDNVLARAMAYNVVALVDFVCTTMEVYYRRRLLDFAHNRVAKPALWLSRLMLKAAYLSADSIQQTSDTTFEVPSASDPAVSYCVEVLLGMCSCASSLCGKFCKHQAAVMQHRSGLCVVHTDTMQHFIVLSGKNCADNSH